ncbi:hypothetical protein E5676_scaffold606G001390 [Cucumis melo var. makuwa]|uniref:Uncharacterized protein n=1 Tax=Cucumis melo var. makuwa TaxID=1194695 RepID=A0A5D3C5N5_CUCMM|nr:hypothetical protein E5676_scaffold606G001390 [Cucumis melo var. makuwa]
MNGFSPIYRGVREEVHGGDCLSGRRGCEQTSQKSGRENVGHVSRTFELRECAPCGIPNWLRIPKEDEHIELKKKGDEDVLKKKVDIGLEESIDVVDDEDVTEIEPFLTQRPHVRPASRKRASVYLSTSFTTLPKRSVTSTTSTSQSEQIVYDPMHKILEIHLDRLRA